MTKNKHLGSNFEDFLKEEGIYEDVTEKAIKKVLAWELEEARKKKRLSKVTMAARMKTSRSALDRLLDPKNTSVTLQTLQRAAAAVGKRLRVSLI
jgi:hypothetical protein